MRSPPDAKVVFGRRSAQYIGIGMEPELIPDPDPEPEPVPECARSGLTVK
jgi:hypothetical protein